MSKKLLIDLIKELATAKGSIKVGDVYYHHRNPSVHYKVKQLCINSETDSVCVAYESINNPSTKDITWIRSIESWDEIDANGVKKFNQLNQ